MQDSLPLSVSLSGTGQQEVLRVLENRRRKGSREDGNRVALVVEGGAMRGIYTAGTLLALHSMGYATLFDNVYGTSAGAVNAAHFLSGVGHKKVDTYYKFLADGRFFNPRRWRKIIDIDFFVDQVLTTLRPVEVEQVLASPSTLWAAVADYDTAEAQVIDATSGEFPLLKVLKAAVAMPIVYNKTVQLGTLRAFDAGFCEPFPLDFALAHGHSHVLVLTARDRSDRASSRGLLERTLFAIFFARGDRALRRAMRGAASRSNRLRDLAHGLTTPPNGEAIATLSPVAPRISSRSQEIDLLRTEMLRTTRDTLRLFLADETQLDEWIRDGSL